MTDFLTNHRQWVSINQCMSQWLAVLSGIPQGSVLGPVLFILYINDLPELVDNFTMLFADDTKLYSTVNNKSDQGALQKDLNKLIQWSNRWQLNFNASKCKVLHYGRKNMQLEYTMNDGQNTLVVQAVEEKDLGILFSGTAVQITGQRSPGVWQHGLVPKQES